MCIIQLKLYNDFLGIYCYKYYGLSDDKRKKMELWSECDSASSENEEESTDKEESEDLPPMPPLEGDQEVVN